MKFLDKVIRYWRVKVALRHVPAGIRSAFDIGCDDGFLLRQLDRPRIIKEGVDPRLEANRLLQDGTQLLKGYFPKCVEEEQLRGPYDVIFALAVFEHFSEEDIACSASAISKLLTPEGKLIVTVPHPFVDRILDVLMFVRLIDGQATEEHHGFDPDDLVKRLSSSMKLVRRERFQFGLNNLFVFGKA